MLVIPTAFLDDTEGVEDLGEAPVLFHQLCDEICKQFDRYINCPVSHRYWSRVGEEGLTRLDQPFIFRKGKEAAVKPELVVDFLQSRTSSCK